MRCDRLAAEAVKRISDRYQFKPRLPVPQAPPLARGHVNMISRGCAGLLPYQLDHVPLLIDCPHPIELPRHRERDLAGTARQIQQAAASAWPRPTKKPPIIATG
jgi:hypothetical protein